jgi:superfamily I DNA and RNA helicase
VVDRDSATFMFTKCENSPFQRDHKQLVKFRERDSDYTKVHKAIEGCIQQSLKPIPVTETLTVRPEEIKKDCIRSLSFKAIGSRFYDIAPAHPHTCEWLFATCEFQQWINRDDLADHNGVLWIKGMAGVGKSTLMKHAVSHCRTKRSDHLIAAYFFNSRGEILEMTLLGL